MEGKGNYWSDYVGYDENNDGVGEMPYKSESLFENLIDKYPNLRVFVFSPVAQAVELASDAFPVIKPEPKVTDMYPLVDPVIPEKYYTRVNRFSFELFVFSIIMILVPAASFMYFRKRI